MNVEFINPFLSSLINVLSTMAQTQLKPGKPRIKTDEKACGDVSGLIGMVGPQTRGSFSIQVALKTYWVKKVSTLIWQLQLLYLVKTILLPIKAKVKKYSCHLPAMRVTPILK